MPNFAIINGSVAVNVIVADDLETANELAIKTGMGQFAIQISQEPNSPGIGCIWNGEEWIFPESATELQP